MSGMWIQEQTPKIHAFKKRMDYMLQNMLTIWSSIVNMAEGVLHDHSMSTRNFTLIMNKILIRAPKITRKVVVASI